LSFKGLGEIKFSIIVPVYNVERYLEACLKSIFAQSYDNYEVLCIDDASTDGSNDILLKYSELYANMHVIQHEQNKGLSAARNTGIKNAIGEYIVFVDSDDMMALGALETLYLEVQNQEYDIVYYNMDIVDEGIYANEHKKEIPEYHEFPGEMRGQELLLEFFKYKELKVEAWRQLYRKEFIKKNYLEYYEGIWHEDILFSIKAALKAQRVKNVNRNLYVYRRRDNSIISSMSEKRIDSLVIIVSEVLGLCKSGFVQIELEKELVVYLQEIIRVIKKYCCYYPDYKTMSIGSATDRLIFSLVQNSYDTLYRFINISEQQIEELRKEQQIIVYGAGSVGTEIVRCLTDNQIKILGIAVTNKEGNTSAIQGYPIKQICEWEYKNALVVVAVKDIKRQKDILSILAELGYERTMIPEFIR